MPHNTLDTIAAISTPSGNGGVGIIRISGSLATHIARQLTNKPFPPRQAVFTAFKDTNDKVQNNTAQNNAIIDVGILLYFPAPNSYTGEDIIELQGHGGVVVLDMLLKRVLRLGARLANPGEFTERAFLNNKLDLVQAESIADLITSSTEQSVRAAQQSMQGVFSKQIYDLVKQLTELRTYIEATLDFADEEIDLLTDGGVATKINNIANKIQKIQKTAQQGCLLRDGMTLVLAGKPNTGKSSLLNVLAQRETAIVTAVAGTTRDILKESIQIEGVPLHIIDTAGLRNSDNIVEKEGVRRAHKAIQQADKILLIIDSTDPDTDTITDMLPDGLDITKIYNKIDLSGMSPKIIESAHGSEIYLSVKKKIGIELLIQHLKNNMGFRYESDNVFIARRRHIEALNKGYDYIKSAKQQLQNQATELVAEDLRHAQNSLAEITGAVSSDDLLGRIFAYFCIGK